MRIAFFVNTPAQVHEFKYAIKTLQDRGHDVLVLARDYGCTLELLEEYGIEYSLYGRTGRSKYGKFVERPFHLFRAYMIARSFAPDLVVGPGDDVSFISLLLGKPGIMFDDSESSPVQVFLHKPFNIAVLTPACFTRDLGKRQVRYRGYKELAYLHPDRFQPDPSIYDLLGISPDEKYVVLRFSAFDTSHDVGGGGFSVQSKGRLAQELQKYACLFISSEGNLPPELKQYEARIPFHRIHDALFYAQMLVADTATMTTEAAVLGTPAVHCRTLIGEGKGFGNFIELEQEYGLIYAYSAKEQDKAVAKAVELIQQPELKSEWQQKRQRLLAEKTDVTQFLVWFIENYPETFRKVKENPSIQERFR